MRCTSAWNNHSPEAAENGTRIEICKHDMLQADGSFANAAMPIPGGRADEVNGSIHFQLIAGAECVFGNDVVLNARGALSVEVRRDDDFVFGERFFGELCQGQVELAARPSFVRTEPTQI